MIDGSQLKKNPPKCDSEKSENCMPMYVSSGYKIGHRPHLTFEQAVEIRSKAKQGIARSDLAAEYSVGIEAIAKIIRGETHRVTDKGLPVPKKRYSSRPRRRFLTNDEKELLFPHLAKVQTSPN